jgi:trans-aconitate 2-methyltransferase
LIACTHRAPGVDIERKTYDHPLQGFDGLVEWFKSTGLLPYRTAGSPRTSRPECVGPAAGSRSSAEGRHVLLSCQRLFIVATR